jgi:alpha/beta superfamily hydrolase
MVVPFSSSSVSLEIQPAEPVVVETVRFRAGPYRLEGELAYPEEIFPAGAAVLAGPHPLLGGTLHNNVVRLIGDGLARQGLATLRFNYRGVGRSEGPPLGLARHLAEFWQSSHVPQEQELHEDLRGACAFLHRALPTTRRALIGYSFGCSLLPRAVQADGSCVFVLIAPTVGRHDLKPFERLPQPKLVIAPRNDFAADLDRLLDWCHALPGVCRLVQPDCDGHFFRGHESDLVEEIRSFLEEIWRSQP